MPLLEVDKLTVAVAKQQILKEVSFSLSAKEALVVVGESGSGKTTLSNAMIGATRLTPEYQVSGSSRFLSHDLLKMSPGAFSKMMGKEISVIVQDPAQALHPLYTIGEQLNELLLKREEEVDLILKALDRVELKKEILARYPHEISGGQKQRAMIAMATLFTPRLLICDEPTSGLDPSIQNEILRLLLNIKEKEKTALFFITHDMKAAHTLADRVMVLYRGELIEISSKDQFFNHPKEAYTKALLDADPVNLQFAPKPEESGGPGFIKLANVSKSYSETGKAPFAVQHVSLTIEEKKIVAFVGESGSGKTTLGRMIAGLIPPTTGLIERNCHPQMIFQNPALSFNPRMRLGDALTEPLIYRGMEPKAALELAKEALVSVNLEEAHLDRFPHQFSLGQKQRLAIARALMEDPKIVIADEIVSALDLSIQAQILELIVKLNREKGIGFVFISHDIACVRAVAENVYVFHRGKLVEEGPTSEVLQNPKAEYTRKLINDERYSFS